MAVCFRLSRYPLLRSFSLLRSSHSLQTDHYQRQHWHLFKNIFMCCCCCFINCNSAMVPFKSTSNSTANSCRAHMVKWSSSNHTWKLLFITRVLFSEITPQVLYFSFLDPLSPFSSFSSFSFSLFPPLSRYLLSIYSHSPLLHASPSRKKRWWYLIVLIIKKKATTFVSKCVT